MIGQGRDMLVVEVDHLGIYEPGMLSNSYLRFGDREWSCWLDNRVLNMNCWRHSEFVRLYRRGSAIVDQHMANSVDSAFIDIPQRWRDLGKGDVDATVTRLIVRRPAGSPVPQPVLRS